jgi:hypothetical protein
MADVKDKSKFKANFFSWPVTRTARTFRVFVVEPREYSPKTHSKIFDAAITSLLIPETTSIDPYATYGSVPEVEPFDLVTFPEAFLPQCELVNALHQISKNLSSIGCVHVGLRPADDPDRHLFSVQEIKALLQSLSVIPKINQPDLNVFSNWIKKQIGENQFNVGCLFTLDANEELRVCLHPKIVRSKFELSPLHEAYMAEADLLTLVTLLPTDKTLKSVTLQPLICSDALHLDTDRPQSCPLDRVNHNADCFGDSLPDHVDVVSVVTCTPQQIGVSSKGIQYRTWHQDFLDSFRRAAGELHRHYYSTFVLSNFQNFPGNTPGGLSGAFIPVSLVHDSFPSFVTVSSWGKLMGENSGNKWSTPDEYTKKEDRWSSLGYVASLDSAALHDIAPAYMFGFIVHRFPRDATRWKSTEGLVDFQLREATYDSERMVFRRWKK